MDSSAGIADVRERTNNEGTFLLEQESTVMFPNRLRITLMALALLVAVPACRKKPQAPPGGIRIRVYNQLGAGQLKENASITIGGATQVIALNEQTPRAYVEFVGQGPGHYLATFQVTTWSYSQGRVAPVTHQGSNTLMCQGDANFQLVLNSATNPPSVKLQPLR